MMKTSVSKSWHKWLFMAASVVIVLQCAKVAWRTVEVVRMAAAPSAVTHQCIGADRAIDLYLEPNEDKLNVYDALQDRLESVDDDDDGLSASKEIRLLTSDLDDDCDKDGFRDPVDTCPNCVGEGFRSRVLGAAIVGALNLTSETKNEDAAASPERMIYVVVPGNEAFNVETTEAVLVSVGRYDETIVRAIGATAQVLEIEDVMYCPGAIYIFRAHLDCGKKCGWGKLVVVLDFPFLGPTSILTHTIYVI